MNPATSNITTHTYKTVGDVKIELDVHIPPVSPPTDGYPVFFAIHEGGYVLGSKDKAFTDEERKEVMKRGWALVSINHRLLPSVFMNDMLEDVQDAYKWVRTELVKTIPINPNLITVFGQSAGGGFAAMSGYKFSPRPQAIISFYPGCTNWIDPSIYKPGIPVDPQFATDAKKFSTPVVTEYHRTGPNDAKMDFWNAVDAGGKLGWLVTTHDPNLPDEEILKSLKSYSATENLDENYPPTYLGHGVADEDVPYSQSVQLADKLKELKIPHVLDLVPDAKHNFDSDPKLWEKHVLPAFDFVQKYMQKNST